jgi:fatty-acyl-CoA synthase
MKFFLTIHLMDTQRDTAPLRAASGYPASVLDAFERFSNRVAFVHRDKLTTYGEALGEVYRLEHALESCGLGREDGVALLTNNQPHHVLARLAIQLLGCRHIAVDRAYSAAEQAHILRDADVTAFIYAPQTHSVRAA